MSTTDLSSIQSNDPQGNPMPDPNITLICEVLSGLKQLSVSVAELTAEIRADRASRDQDRASMDRAREAMERSAAIFDDRCKKEDQTEEIASKSKENRWQAVKATGSYVGGLLKTPLGTLAIAAAGYLAASYLHAPPAIPAENPPAAETTEEPGE